MRKQVCDQDQMTDMHKFIISAIQQLQSHTPYGAIQSEVQERVLASITISQAEYTYASPDAVDLTFMLTSTQRWSTLVA